MPVIEDRKKFRPDEKNLPNLLIEKVGRQTVVGLDLVAIPIRDLGGRNPRRIHMKIISIDAQGSSGQAKLVLWDADATNEVEIQKIMNKSIFIESSWINWYKKEYQVRKFSSEIVLLKHTTEIYLKVNNEDGVIQVKRINKCHNETESEGKILQDESEDSDKSDEEKEKEDTNESDTCDDKSEGPEESDDNCEGDIPPVYLHLIFEISSVTRIFFNFEISSLNN